MSFYKKKTPFLEIIETPAEVVKKGGGGVSVFWLKVKKTVFFLRLP